MMYATVMDAEDQAESLLERTEAGESHSLGRLDLIDGNQMLIALVSLIIEAIVLIPCERLSQRAIRNVVAHQ